MPDPKGFCLTIGLNKVDRGSPSYQGVNVPLLDGCVPDAQSIAALFGKQPGFQTPTILLDGQATREDVLGQLDSAARSLQSGDLFVLHYSGHGMQGGIDESGQPNPDSASVTSWVLFNAPLASDELFRKWSEFQSGVRILVLSDSCFSGSAVRKIGPASVAFTERGLEQGQRKKVINNNLEFFRQRPVAQGSSMDPTIPEIAVPPALLLISACKSTETAMDTEDTSGNPHGLFTSVVLDVWNNGAFSDSYDAFHAQIEQLTNSRSLQLDPSHTQQPNKFPLGNLLAVTDFMQSGPPFMV